MVLVLQSYLTKKQEADRVENDRKQIIFAKRAILKNTTLLGR